MPTVLDTIAKWLREAKSAVAFTGAGISTESGIPDFRSPGGVWAANRQILFQEFLEDAEARFEYWRQKAISHEQFLAASPNLAHQTLARWEANGVIKGVITQNIDGLHSAAGHHRVLELHGTARQVGCLSCEVRFDADTYVVSFNETQSVPSCPECGGFLKHATVSFGQSLPSDVLQEAAQWSNDADLFLAMGSSLVVEPAASLPVIAKRAGATLVIINRDETPLDGIADAVSHSALGETLAAIDAAM